MTLLSEITYTMFYVPLLKSVEVLLKDEGIYAEVSIHISVIQTYTHVYVGKKGHSLFRPGAVADFCDGTYFSNHLIFKKKLAALQVCLYYDNVEVCNPLSSRRGKHKLGNCRYR